MIITLQIHTPDMRKQKEYINLNINHIITFNQEKDYTVVNCIEGRMYYVVECDYYIKEQIHNLIKHGV